MTLIILLVFLILLIYLSLIFFKKIYVRKNIISICVLLTMVLGIFLYYMIPIKMAQTLKQAQLQIVEQNQLPTLPNIVWANIDTSKQYLIVKPDGVMHNVQFYLVEYKDDKFVENNLVKTVDKVDANQNLVIEAIVPEGVPNLKIKWLNKDYLKGEMIISYNGKDGGINDNDTYKHTIRSIIISLLK